MSTGSAPCERSDPQVRPRIGPEIDGHKNALPPEHIPPPGPALQFGFDTDRRRMTVRGDIDFANSAALADAMTALFARELGMITVDVGELTIADPASLTLFLAACKALGDKGVQLRIVGATTTARRACQAADLGALLADD